MLRGTPEHPKTFIGIYVVVAVRGDRRTPLYAGQAKHPRHRFRTHVSNSCDTRAMRETVRAFRGAGYRLELDVVCWCVGRARANRVERRLIERLRSRGFVLVNRSLIPYVAAA